LLRKQRKTLWGYFLATPCRRANSNKITTVQASLNLAGWDLDCYNLHLMLKILYED